jgi:hypothetical protein
MIAALLIAAMGLGVYSVTTTDEADASLILCVTHFSKQPGPSGYAAHTVGNFISGTEYKIVQYFQAGPGYLYLVRTSRRFCG